MEGSRAKEAKHTMSRSRRLSRSLSVSLSQAVAVGLLLRVGIYAFGWAQDHWLRAYSSVRFEDIDYSVFSDGAARLARGCPLALALAPDAADAWHDPAVYASSILLSSAPSPSPSAPLFSSSSSSSSSSSPSSSSPLSAGGLARGEPKEAACAVGLLPLLARLALQRDPSLWSDEDLTFYTARAGGWFRLVLESYNLMRPTLVWLAQVGDPFARPTYRYTPLLAALVAISQRILSLRDAGKILFLAADLAVGVLLWKLVDLRADNFLCLHPSSVESESGREAVTQPDAQAKSQARSESDGAAASDKNGISSKKEEAWWGHQFVLWFWFLNPIPAQIAARGSAESVIAVLVLGFLYTLLSSNPESPPGWNALCQAQAEQNDALASSQTTAFVRSHDGFPASSLKQDQEIEQEHDEEQKNDEEQEQDEEQKELDERRLTAWFASEASFSWETWSGAGWASPILLALAVHMKIYPALYAAPVAVHLFTSARRAGYSGTKAVFRWGLVCALSFILITAAVWAVWGRPYLEHSWLYHLTRKDHRHNFSPYFLPIYLSTVPAWPSPLSSSGSSVVGGSGWLWWTQSPLLSFLPQMAAAVGGAAILASKDLVLALFVGTHAFVHLNKVVTSQYFLWYLFFLPILLPRTRWTRAGALVVSVLWVGGQGLWLAQAHQLENYAQDKFLATWAYGLAFVLANALVAAQILCSWFAWYECQLNWLIQQAKKNARRPDPLDESARDEAGQHRLPDDYPNSTRTAPSHRN